MTKSFICIIIFFAMPYFISAQIKIIRDINGNIIKESYPNNYSIAYAYDSSGNRIETVASQSICPNDNSLFYAGKNDLNLSYQWQVDTGTGYIDIIDDSIYAGTQTPYLKLLNAPTRWYGYKYRCLINGTEYSSERILKFQLIWNGKINTEWENAANWNCNKLPDQYTDVYIYGGSSKFFPLVSMPSACRSLNLVQGATCTLLNSQILNIAGK